MRGVGDGAGGWGMNGLRRLRERRLLTQTELARLVGVRRYQTIGRWERGEDRPRAGHLRALCAALEVTPDELLAALAEEHDDAPRRP